MDGKQYFLGAVYNTDCQFSSPFDFFPLTTGAFDGVGYNKGEVIQKLDNLINDFNEKTTYPLTNEGALNVLVANDLSLVRKKLAGIDFNDVETEMRLAYDKYITLLNELGFTFQPPELFIVDSFPVPYQDMSWFAFTADAGDERKHGIKRGLYFLRRHLRPTYSAIMLGHEMIHKIFPDADAVYYARGLEEGIANLLGIFYLAGGVYGLKIVERYFHYMYLSDTVQLSNQLYFEYTKQVAFLVTEFGFGGVVSLVKKGRLAIKRVEEKLYKGELNNLGLDAGERKSEIEKSIAQLVFCFVRSLVASPLAYYLIPFVKQWATIEEIAKGASADIDATRTALNELQTQLSLIVIYRDQVSNSDLEVVSNTIRYKAKSSS